MQLAAWVQSCTRMRGRAQLLHRFTTAQPGFPAAGHLLLQGWLACASQSPAAARTPSGLRAAPFKIEALEQHELLLSDMSLAPPDQNGKCRRLYDRLGVHADNLFGCGSSLHLISSAHSAVSKRRSHQATASLQRHCASKLCIQNHPL